MTKGKPWPVDDERKLRDWFTSGITDIGVLSFSFNGEYTEQVVRQKLIRLVLLKEEVGQSQGAPCPTSSKLQKEEETSGRYTSSVLRYSRMEVESVFSFKPVF